MSSTAIGAKSATCAGEPTSADCPGCESTSTSGSAGPACSKSSGASGKPETVASGTTGESSVGSPRSIQFTVPGVAVGKGRARVGKSFGGHARMYTPEKTMNYEGLVAWTAAQVMAGRPLIEGPVRLALEVACAVPASWSMKKTAAALRGEVRPTTKPDLDNIAKIAGDALNGVVWRDDVQVVTLSAHKRYSESPSLSFFIEAL